MRKGIERGVWLWLVLLGVFAQDLRAGVPEWVHQAAAQPPGAYPVETKAVVLLDSSEYTITNASEFIAHHRRVVRILRPEGRGESEFRIHLERDDKLLSARAWSIDPSGHQVEIKEKEFLESNPYSFELYSDVRYRTVKVSAGDPGAIVALEYEVRRHPWLNQLHWHFQEDIPVRAADLVVQLPAGWGYKAAWAAAPPAEPAQEGGNRWHWTVREVGAIEEEPRMPAPWGLAGRVVVAYFGPGAPAAGSWAGVGQWYAGLTAGRRTATSEISEKAHQLTAGKTDFDGKLRALASFMQNDVRYVAIEIGIGGYQPHAAGDIFHARYGDCKDKATLLSSLFQEAGIRSDYVLIDTRRGMVSPDQPSSSFDHAILAVELPAEVSSNAYASVLTARTGKRYLIFDPTDEYTPVGMLRADLQDTYALLVTEAGGELIHTPVLPPETNVLSRNGHFTLGADGTLSGEVLETLSGDHASRLRSRLTHANQLERLQQLERGLNRSLKGFVLQSGDVQHLNQVEKELLLTLKFTVPRYGQIRGPLMLVRPRVLGVKSFDLEHKKPRRYPIELEGAARETDVYEIDVPPEYKVDDIPDPVKMDMGFASYQSKTELVRSKIRYWRELIVRDLQVAPERLADLRKLEGTIGADENAAVVLKRAP